MKKNKLLDIFNLLFNLVAIAQSIYLGQWLIAIVVSLLFLLSQLLIYRENFLREQRTKKLLNILSRIETCSAERV